jgi:tetratricopeptide (TPR) repeat protein
MSICTDLAPGRRRIVTSRARLWPLTLVLIAEALTTGSAYAAQYVVDGFALGAHVDPANANYLTYKCEPSRKFADAVQCHRTQQGVGPAGEVSVSNTLIHAKGGTVLYGVMNITPLTLSKEMARREIEEFSHTFGARPTTLMWLPKDSPLTVMSLRTDSNEPTSVIATWGPVKLKTLGTEARDAIVEGGTTPYLGILVDTLGNPGLSVKQYLPVYRLVGGPGYVYAASLDDGKNGHRQYAAINASELAIRQSQLSLQAVLQKDQSLSEHDYRLWPPVATIARTLALDTSPDATNRALDKVFDEAHSSKLRSHAWSIIPMGAIRRLAMHHYWRHDVYGPDTKYPEIRRDAERLLASQPPDPFIDFAYFIVGDFDNALKTNPSSVIAEVLHYAAGYKIIQTMLQEALESAETHMRAETPALVQNQLRALVKADPNDPFSDHVNSELAFVNQQPDLFDRRPLTSFLTTFAARATEARAHFEAVLKHLSAPHADDSAYMIGWLELQQGNSSDALKFFSKALVTGDEVHDYLGAALRELIRILEKLPPYQQVTAVESDEFLSREPALWYVAARSAYRDFDYPLAIDIGHRGLKALNIPEATLPVTTDPKRISAALKKINPKLLYDPNLPELPYLIEASREISQYETYVNTVAREPPEDFAKKARAIIVKYSELLDRGSKPATSHSLRAIQHKDFRQAIHLIDITLQQTPKDAKYGALRAWLHYRKVRVLTVYAPIAVTDAVSAMQQEFPGSQLLNDALAEQIFAEGIMLGDVEAAEKTFVELLAKYPKANGVDNAFSWMAIILRCDGRGNLAQKLDKEIIRRFPLTRHAKYAMERLADPEGAMGGVCFHAERFWTASR